MMLLVRRTLGPREGGSIDSERLEQAKILAVSQLNRVLNEMATKKLVVDEVYGAKLLAQTLVALEKADEGLPSIP